VLPNQRAHASAGEAARLEKPQKTPRKPPKIGTCEKHIQKNQEQLRKPLIINH
jgi:hypothetical protein